MMSATFKHRYKEIQNHAVPVSTILQKYPALKTFDEVRYLHMHEKVPVTCLSFFQMLQEFGRILKTPEVRKNAREEWNTWAPRVIALASKSSYKALTNFLHDHSTTDDLGM